MKDFLIDFGLPALVIIGCFALLFTGRDSEIKSILALAAGWIFHSGYTKNQATMTDQGGPGTGGSGDPGPGDPGGSGTV